MLVAHRRDLLVERLRVDGRIVAKDLAVEFGVSEDSVRRDLRDLAAAGLCQRVYGGALPISPAVGDYTTRRQVATDSKHRVAKAAAALLRPGCTAILDGGTTNLLVAHYLPLDLHASVITHSPTIAVALAEHTDVDVTIIGGRLFRHSMVACGAIASEAAGLVSADLFLLGVTGVHERTGLTTGDVEEAAMKRTLAGRAADVYVLASAEKVGAASPYSVLPLAAISGIVTDASAEHSTIVQLRAAGVAILPA